MEVMRHKTVVDSGFGRGWRWGAQSEREVHSKWGGGNAISSSIGSVARVKGGGGGGNTESSPIM